MKKNYILLISFIIVIFILALLSNYVLAATANESVESISDVKVTWQLAELVGNGSFGSAGSMFALNKVEEKYGDAVGIKVNEVADDVDYRSTLCLFHGQGTAINSCKEIQNVIWLNSSGDVTVNSPISITEISIEEGEIERWKQEGDIVTEIVDLNQYSGVKRYEVKYEVEEVSLSDSQREDVQILSYLMAEAMKCEEEQPGYTRLKSTIQYWWHTKVKGYLSGYLNSYYTGAVTTKDKGVYHQEYYNEAYAAITAKNSNIKLETCNTTPEVYYSEDGKAYIGPFQVKYTAPKGPEKLIVNAVGNSGGGGGRPGGSGGNSGITASWTTKNTDGTFNEEQSGVIPSEQIFYAVVDATTIENANTVDVKLVLEYISSSSSGASIALAHNKTGAGQTLMFFSAYNSSSTKTKTANWSVANEKPRYATIIIQKEGANGTRLEGIGFKLWRMTGPSAKYIQLGSSNSNGYKPNGNNSNNSNSDQGFTDSSGEITISKLEVGRSEHDWKFLLTETTNDGYGYKSKAISEVYINGVLTPLDSSGGIVFTVDESTTEVRILIKNEQLLGDIELTKYGYDTNDRTISDVEFVVKNGNNYVQLTDASGNIVWNVTGTATINSNNVAQGSEYKINYISSKIDGLARVSATRFKTDSSGIIRINNLEQYASATSTYTYTFEETSNKRFAYQITSNVGQQTSISVIGKTTNSVSMTNKGGLGNIEITKQELENVEFVVGREDGYVQLTDSSGSTVERIVGSATLSDTNIAEGSTYQVNYVSEQESATIFVTDSSGTVFINNLEVFKKDGTNYNYTVTEIKNSSYGYGARENLGVKSTNNTLSVNGTKTIDLTNNQYLGDISIDKKDSEYENIILSDVEFVIEIGSGNYIQLENTEGIISYFRGSATINKKNIAQGTEYKVNYVSSKESATKFITDSTGSISIKNLEVYSSETGDEYTYSVTEISNSNYGYEVNSGESTVELGEKVTVGNIQRYVKISGYVWLENSSGKTNTYDCLYTSGGADKKLTDLYSTSGGTTLNTSAQIPVEIKLCNKSGKVIKSKPDEFNADGKYTFNDVEVAQLSNYQVVFIYDGFYYASVAENLNQDNGSKVADSQADRNSLNDKFTTVKDNSQVVSADGTVNNVVYTKEGHTSTLSDILFDTTIKATTADSGYSLSEALHNLKKAPNTSTVECIDNINMGIVLREQPKISINSDIYSVLVGINGYNYNYKYNGRQNYYENKNGDGIGVKFEQEYVAQRYTRTVYASDIQAASTQGKNIDVEITYKLQIANESSTLKIIPKQIINYFDARYSVKAIGISYDSNNYTTIQSLGYSTVQGVAGHSEYNSTIIDFGQEVEAGKENIKDIYITFALNRDAIIDLLNEKSTYHYAAEVLSYASYYGSDTAKFMSDDSSQGSVYAGIDKMSQPGNMEISLIAHPSGGTDILDTTYFEDDTTSAPALILEKSEVRMLSGVIWEDTDANTSDNERIGDGIYNKATEKPIANVKISLHKLNSDGSIDPNVATYSNGSLAETYTDESGNYRFGEPLSSGAYYGVEPGKYVIQFTYNNQSYIVDSSGNKYINVNDYKSTIITSSIIKNAYEASNPDTKWYIIKELDGSNNIIQYSDARDDIVLRNENDTVKYSTYKGSSSPTHVMNAYTPNMEIGIEFTRENESVAIKENFESITFENEFKNIDFGIIERPLTKIEIEKKITALEIIGQNGATIIPKGDPSDPSSSMAGVKTGLKGIVPIEIESGLLQGAQLNVEYTITIKRDSELDYDYNEENAKYYFYGEKQKNAKYVKIEKVVDYLDNTMTISENPDGLWKNDYDANKLHDEGYISDEVYRELTSSENGYNIYYTEAFSDMNAEDTKEVKLYATRYLAVANETSEANRVEIIELSGGRVEKSSIPGNYVPSKSPSESDEDRVDLIITPPTGLNTNYMLYIASAIITTAILIAGIIIIKKKVIK